MRCSLDLEGLEMRGTGTFGKLTDLAPGKGTATKLPVPIDAAPYGIAVLAPGS